MSDRGAGSERTGGGGAESEGTEGGAGSERTVDGRFWRVINLEAIPSVTQFFKRAYKTSYPPQLEFKTSWVALLSFA